VIRVLKPRIFDKVVVHNSVDTVDNFGDKMRIAVDID
jgi:hypothetical protein